MKNNNDAIIARIRGVRAKPGNMFTDADPRNPNKRDLPKPENDNQQEMEKSE